MHSALPKPDATSNSKIKNVSADTNWTSTSRDVSTATHRHNFSRAPTNEPNHLQHFNQPGILSQLNTEAIVYVSKPESKPVNASRLWAWNWRTTSHRQLTGLQATATQKLPHFLHGSLPWLSPLQSSFLTTAVGRCQTGPNFCSNKLKMFDMTQFIF